MRLVCFVYPASKSVAYLLNGLQSKNVRSRAEGLDELAHIVSETGYRTVGRKGLQKIAALIATGEKDVRDTAIDVIEAVWMQVRARSLPICR
jgi:cytoskeleton-associated protein 5